MKLRLKDKHTSTQMKNQPNSDGQTYDFKVSACCEDCASKIKDKLQEINGVNSIILHTENETLQDKNQKIHHVSIYEEKDIAVEIKKRKKAIRSAKSFRSKLTRLGKRARLLLSNKIEKLLTETPPPSPPRPSSIVPKKEPSLGTMQKPNEEPMGPYLPYFHVNNNWARPPLPPPWPRPQLSMPHYPPYASHNPYGYGLTPPPYSYGYQNPYGYNNVMPPSYSYGYPHPNYHNNLVDNRMGVHRRAYPYYSGQRRRDPPVGNSYFDIFSDDHTSSICSIM